MTALHCRRCRGWWTVHTLHPDPMRFLTHRICPTCIPMVARTVMPDDRPRRRTR